MVLVFFGICGAQRFYANKTGSGLLYLFTLGFLGIGQFIDLFLTGEMIDTYNRYNLPGAYNVPLAQQQVVVNVAESIHSAISEKSTKGSDTDKAKTDEQLILEACENEPITIARISIKTSIEPKKVKALVEQLEAEGMLAANISESGQIKYLIN